jgi:hypothetical protein
MTARKYIRLPKTYAETSPTGSVKFTISGLTDFRNTTMEIGDIETEIPISPFPNRKSAAIFNLSPDYTLYLGKTGVTADRSLGNTAGWEVQPQSAINIDFAADVHIYGITTSGNTILVKIMEMS